VSKKQEKYTMKKKHVQFNENILLYQQIRVSL